VSTVVLKIGGASTSGAAQAVRAFRAAGRDVCVVHGAGPQISAELERRGLASEFVDGRRVTTPGVLEVVRESLAAVNAALCTALGADAVGLMGDEIGLAAAQVEELGLVGEPTPCAPAAVVAALASGRVPVVAPLACGPLNVNADEMAAALAVGLGAERIWFLTDVPGLLLDGSVVEQIDADEADALLAGGLLEGGILPKLRAAVTAARRGVRAEIGETAVTCEGLA
jgi:acetylglutamate kinase